VKELRWPTISNVAELVVVVVDVDVDVEVVVVWRCWEVDRRWMWTDVCEMVDSWYECSRLT
jgi:hypothetical protein